MSVAPFRLLELFLLHTELEGLPRHLLVFLWHSIDLSGCSGERKAAINSRTLAGARVAYKALTGPLDPVNEGSFRALDVIIPEGNIMMARFPAPMAGWSAIVPTVVDTIVAALRQGDARPGAGRPSWPARRRRGVLRRATRRPTGASWCRASRAAAGAAGRTEDGESATVSVCQGDVRNGSIEGIELKCPVLVESRALRRDSGGAGKAPRRARHRHAACATSSRAAGISSIPARSDCPPWGLWGGTPGRTGDFLLRLPGENDFRSMDASHYPVPVDSEVIVRTGGGGGWGDPLERDAAAVRSDVIEEFVSRRFAEETYGVVLRDDLTLDEVQTEQRRNALRSTAK